MVVKGRIFSKAGGEADEIRTEARQIVSPTILMQRRKGAGTQRGGDPNFTNEHEREAEKEAEAENVNNWPFES